MQIGTGKVAQRFREVAPDADRLLGTKDALLQIRQFRANNDLVAKRLEVMESAPPRSTRSAAGSRSC